MTPRGKSILLFKPFLMARGKLSRKVLKSSAAPEFCLVELKQLNSGERCFMSPLFSPDPAINESRERPSVLCVVIITASSSTLQPPCTPALGHWEKSVCFLLLQELLMGAMDPDLNVDAQKSVSH